MTVANLFAKHRAAPILLALALLVVILAALLAVGAFSSGPLPSGFSSRRQLLGADMLLVLMPPYLLFAWGMLQRRSLAHLGQIDRLAPGNHFQQRALTPARVLFAGALAGMAYAIAFNLPVASLTALLDGDALLVVLVTCMILVWVSAGVALAARIHTSGTFLAAGREVPLDLFDRQPLEPFAREGMGDMLMVAGALVLTTVQSIDATFRYQNYVYALLVALPAAALLLIRPMWSVHQRLRALKGQELAAVSERIRTAPRHLDEPAMTELETLLQRRHRIHEASTWPINVAMVSRMILYGVLPPLAWVAAALVERTLEGLLGG